MNVYHQKTQQSQQNIMIPRSKKFNRFSGLVNAKTKGNCQSSRREKAAAVGRRPASLVMKRHATRLNGRKERFIVWQSQVMHLNIVSLACRFCILVANLIFLEVRFFFPQPERIYSLEIPQTKK